MDITGLNMVRAMSASSYLSYYRQSSSNYPSPRLLAFSRIMPDSNLACTKRPHITAGAITIRIAREPIKLNIILPSRHIDDAAIGGFGLGLQRACIVPRKLQRADGTPTHLY